MKKNLFNRLVAKMFGKSNTTSRAPKSRKLVLESLERRNLLAVGSPAVVESVESVESVAPATAFYAAENVNIDAAPALAVTIQFSKYT